MSRFLKQRPPQGLAAKLSPAQRATLIAWLKVETNTFARVRELLHEKLGITTSEAALGAWYKKNAEAILGPMPHALPAAGMALLITFAKPDQVRVSVRALQPGEVPAQDGESMNLSAGGVEITAAHRADGVVSVAIHPTAIPAT